MGYKMAGVMEQMPRPVLISVLSCTAASFVGGLIYAQLIKMENEKSETIKNRI